MFFKYLFSEDMDLESCCRFVLLDFGHPMNPNSTNNVIKSLENTLTLGLAYPQNAKEIIFGITVLNSDFAIFGLQSELCRNYNSIIKNLNAALKTKMISIRVTIQEYRHLLSNSIDVIFHELQKLQKSSNICSQSVHWKIQVAVVTKKTASVLADILVDVTNKLQRNNPLLSSVKKFKVVQILSADEEIRKDVGGNSLIDWISCSDTVYSLNCFFKEWLLHRQRQLRILLSNDINLEVKCDVEDCIINPVPIIFDGRFDLFNDIRSKGTQKSGFDLEILHRLPVSGLCPTFVYGIPRRIFPTGLKSSNWIESEVNSKIFKELCQKLYQTGEGLLGKLVLPTEKNQFKAFHFLTSDGDILLMNDIAPEELYLPSRTKLPETANSQNKESAASVIETCFEKINLLNEYNPKYFSSGVYDCLKDYLGKAGESRSLFGLDPNVKLFGKNCGKKKTDSKRGSDNISICGNKSSNGCENAKKRLKKTSGAGPENIHPALLSPDIVEKYRKIHSKVFNIPELSKDYV